MTILTLRTDKPQAEMGLYRDGVAIAQESWLAHRQLAETIHQKIQSLLVTQHLELTDLQGIVAYKGPGSFTGLRIGQSVANALAYSLGVPIVTNEGATWTTDGITRLKQGENEQIGIPNYGSLPHITAQKH